ncbi:MAG: M1 family metallopeptidase [Chitinophagales bacterium]
MRYFLLLLAALMLLTSCRTTAPNRQHSTIIYADSIVVEPKNDLYQASATKFFDLIHTRIDARFDWTHQWLLGTATIQLKPHCYPQQTLDLDAKNMEIHEVALLNNTRLPLPFAYDTQQIHITLPKPYTAADTLQIFIRYAAKPNDHAHGGSAAITDDKGLYFINPLGTDSNKPQEIWTQGETESASCWFPTLDHPNQKSTDDIFITVDKKLTTLSNGLLVEQIPQGDLRTDHWQMKQPHAPYLFMMAVGEFVVTHDTWRGLPVDYYMEPRYAHMARRIFGETPAMMSYFSDLLGVPYPWPKYAQIVARDYVSGAMENTSATLHGETLNLDSRTILDGDYHDYISHELFHQWFGDYVTAESWSNLTVNESFANYGEYLWNEHRYGTLHADEVNYEDLEKYIDEATTEKVEPLVRFQYNDREDMFDAHSYEKGGRILHMLRHEIGDSAFFQAMRLYLTSNAYKSAEATQWRLAVEEVTGRDMNIFFKQWYYTEGHPVLRFNYEYERDSAFFTISQRQNNYFGYTYELPLTLALHFSDHTERHQVVLNKKKMTFAFPCTTAPLWMDGDDDHVLLCEKSDNQSTAQYALQFSQSLRYRARREALEAMADSQLVVPLAEQVFLRALRDSSVGIRSYAAENISLKGTLSDSVRNELMRLASTDRSVKVRKAAIEQLASTHSKIVLPVLEQCLGDSSWTIVRAAIKGVYDVDARMGLQQAAEWYQRYPAEVRMAVAAVYEKSRDTANLQWYRDAMRMESGRKRVLVGYYFANYLCQQGAATTLHELDQLTASLRETEHEGTRRIMTRIANYFQKKKQLNDSILQSSQKVKSKYDLNDLRQTNTLCNLIIKKTSAAIDALKQ